MESTEPTKKKTIFGIDLGTTYSCIAYVDQYGQPVVLPSAESSPTTPSVVFFEQESNIVVGENAKESTPLAPDRVASMFKSDMGQEDWRFKPFGEDGKHYRPQEISKYVLQKLAQDAEVACGIKVEEVVITCPAYFGVAQKAATRQAGELAGLIVRDIVPEPTAAALAYGFRTGADETILVYDLGGGTFDVAIMDIRGNGYIALTTGGDARLGGGNWDKALAGLLASKLSDQTGQPVEAITGDPEFYAQLLLDAEKIKRRLSGQEKAKVVESFAGERVTLEISREEFDAVTQSLLDRTVTLTRETMANNAAAGLPKPTRICMVGGSCYMLQVKARLAQEFPELPMQLEDPNQIVAKGAAQFALQEVVKDAVTEELGGTKPEEATPQQTAEAVKRVSIVMSLPPAVVDKMAKAEITSITSRGFGVVVVVDDAGTHKVFNLVHVDQRLPAEPPGQSFGTMVDDQPSVRLRIFETERRTSDENPLLDEGECIQLVDDVLQLDRAYPKGEAIEVKFGLTKDGTLSVEASHPRSGRKLPLQLKVTGVMSDAAVAEAIQMSDGIKVT